MGPIAKETRFPSLVWQGSKQGTEYRLLWFDHRDIPGDFSFYMMQKKDFDELGDPRWLAVPDGSISASHPFYAVLQAAL